MMNAMRSLFRGDRVQALLEPRGCVCNGLAEALFPAECTHLCVKRCKAIVENVLFLRECLDVLTVEQLLRFGVGCAFCICAEHARGQKIGHGGELFHRGQGFIEFRSPFLLRIADRARFLSFLQSSLQRFHPPLQILLRKDSMFCEVSMLRFIRFEATEFCTKRYACARSSALPCTTEHIQPVPVDAQDSDPWQWRRSKRLRYEDFASRIRKCAH